MSITEPVMPMIIETDVDLKPYNTLGLSAVAPALVRIRSEADLSDVLRHPVYGPASKQVLGGGSNIILNGAAPPVVLKIEINGRRLVRENENEWIIEVGAGENWDDLVAWTLSNGWPGLENLALIPGTAGAAPIQNIGAYGVEIKDRFSSLDVVDLQTGRGLTLSAEQCRFGYRDSVFKHELSGRCVITRLRLRLPKPWKPVLDYPGLPREHEGDALHPGQVYEWICTLRRAKLPDLFLLGNAGSFFKNPVVDRRRHTVLIDRHPDMACYPLPDGSVKLSAGWMIQACGWKGKRIGRVGVYDKQALVLVNYGGATAGELMALAEAIRNSVLDRFGVWLEIEPTVI